MIFKKKVNEWVAKCDICSWNTIEKEKIKAKRKLTSHIAISHKKTKSSIKKKKRPIPKRVLDHSKKGRF